MNGHWIAGGFARHNTSPKKMASLDHDWYLGGHPILKDTGGAGWIVWGLGFWLGKYILEFFKNIDLDNS